MEIVDTLLASDEPAVRYKVRVGTLGEDPNSRSMRALAQHVKRSPLVQTLLSRRDRSGRVMPAHNPYTKWYGAHWVLAHLAEIGYPSSDRDLHPVRDQVLAYWLRPQFVTEFPCTSASRAKKVRGVPILNGRARRCASQQGNALFSIVKLGFLDQRCEQLAERLMHWQWPDGGWNCDVHAKGDTSSFWESLTPLRGLVAYVSATGDTTARAASERAAEVFLSRALFRRRRDGALMNRQFLELHYPCYWRYDILFGLKVMAEAGFISDRRCNEALDRLEEKRLPDGGWPAEARFYRNSAKLGSGVELVSWGGVRKRTMNPWVTADALMVLTAAGRL